MKAVTIRLEERLQSMKGQTFLYKTFPTVIITYNFDGDYCTVATDRQWITRPVSELIKLLDDFLPCEEDEQEVYPARIPQETFEVPKIEMTQRFTSLADIVMENITKVKQDSAYVAQAQVINNSVNMIIKMAQTEIEAVKTVHEIIQHR
ncbi:hypothetical protein [Spirosoma agri]|uniref:Uncharacterized protein n=1 Tax=Spirosoma agri TaxID=1987381 RepID=A0A6M0II46_9BACT|nr:hypothetical protein [Spirosoma agri]NEU67930.1 hypothetical protein [Spirosoma agri]